MLHATSIRRQIERQIAADRERQRRMQAQAREKATEGEESGEHVLSAVHDSSELPEVEVDSQGDDQAALVGQEGWQSREPAAAGVHGSVDHSG